MGNSKNAAICIATAMLMGCKTTGGDSTGNPLGVFEDSPVAASIVGAVASTVTKSVDGVGATFADAGTKLFLNETVSKSKLSSEAKERADKHHRKLANSGKLYSETDDPGAVRYLRRVTRRIAASRDSDAVDLRSFIVKDDTVNASTSGAGYLYFNRGLLTALSNEAQLAMIVGHEAAHIDLGHIVSRATDRNRVALGAQALSGVLGNRSTLTDLGVKTGAVLVVQNFSRDDEREADKLGLQYVIAAGYDPVEAATAFQAISTGKSRSSALGNLFSSHPVSQARFNAISALARQSGSGGGDVNGPEYRNMTAALSIEAAGALREQGEYAAAERVIGGRLGSGIETADGYLEKGRVLMARNTGGSANIGEAILMFEEARRLDPARADIQREIGMAYFERGEKGDAEKSIEALTSYLEMVRNPRDADEVRRVIELQKL